MGLSMVGAMVPLVTVPFVLALLLTAVLGPIARWLGRRLPRSLACFLAVVFGIADGNCGQAVDAYYDVKSLTQVAYGDGGKRPLRKPRRDRE